MIRITDTISIDESELSESFVRASGPGGQNVNKLSTAAQLRFDTRRIQLALRQLVSYNVTAMRGVQGIPAALMSTHVRP